MEHAEQPARSPIDLRVIIPAANANDHAAQVELLTITERIAMSTLRRCSEIDIDEVMAEVRAAALPCRFDPNRPFDEEPSPDRKPRAIADRYYQYVRKIVFATVADELARATRERITNSLHYHGNPLQAPSYENSDVTAALPDEPLRNILSDYQYTVFSLRRDGHSNSEIAAKLGRTDSGIRMTMHRVRTLIETTFLEPAGIHPVTSSAGYNHNALLGAIAAGRMRALQILGRWYAHEDWLLRRRPVSEATHVRLGTLATQRTITAFRRRYPDRIVVECRISYISRQDIPLVEEIERTRPRRRPTPSPDPDCVYLPDLNLTASEDSFIRTRVTRGGFSRVVRQHGKEFVPASEVEAFLKEYQETESSA